MLVVTNLPPIQVDVRDAGSIPGLGRSPGGGHGNPLQYSCLENPMDRGAWKASAHRVTQSRTWLKWLGDALLNTPAQNWLSPLTRACREMNYLTFSQPPITFPNAWDHSSSLYHKYLRSLAFVDANLRFVLLRPHLDISQITLSLWQTSVTECLTCSAVGKQAWVDYRFGEQARRYISTALLPMVLWPLASIDSLWTSPSSCLVHSAPDFPQTQKDQCF